MKVTVMYQKGRLNPFRVKCGHFDVYLSSRAEAQRVKQFIIRILNGGAK